MAFARSHIHCIKSFRLSWRQTPHSTAVSLQRYVLTIIKFVFQKRGTSRSTNRKDWRTAINQMLYQSRYLSSNCIQPTSIFITKLFTTLMTFQHNNVWTIKMSNQITILTDWSNKLPYQTGWKILIISIPIWDVKMDFDFSFFKIFAVIKTSAKAATQMFQM